MRTRTERLRMLRPIDSVTHAHLVHTAGAELRRRGGTETVRVLDVGCGNGRLLLAVYRHLGGLVGRPVEAWGFDVSDARVQRSDFFSQTMELLSAEASDVPWHERLSLLRSGEPWPAADGSVDLVLTNQVLEHVTDLHHFLGELRRVLKPNGVCINLFPTKSVVVEQHVGAPFVHWIASDDVRRAFLRVFAGLGLSRFGPMRITKELSAAEWSSGRSEYVASQTSYRSFREIARLAHFNGLSASYRWSSQFYKVKLAYVLKRKSTGLYSRVSPPVFREWLWFQLLSRVSAVCIVFEDRTLYDPDSVGAH